MGTKLLYNYLRNNRNIIDNRTEGRGAREEQGKTEGEREWKEEVQGENESVGDNIDKGAGFGGVGLVSGTCQGW